MGVNEIETTKLLGKKQHFMPITLFFKLIYFQTCLIVILKKALLNLLNSWNIHYTYMCIWCYCKLELSIRPHMPGICLLYTGSYTPCLVFRCVLSESCHRSTPARPAR